jgi:hypothetical protein
VERVAHAVRSHFPHARCFACVAHVLDVTEAEVRNAAHALVLVRRFGLVTRVCYRCSRAGDTVVPEADPQA